MGVPSVLGKSALGLFQHTSFPRPLLRRAPVCLGRVAGDGLLAVGQGEVSVEVLMDADGASEQCGAPSDALDL